MLSSSPKSTLHGKTIQNYMLLHSHADRITYQHYNFYSKHPRPKPQRLSKRYVNCVEQLTQEAYTVRDSFPLMISINPCPHNKLGQMHLHYPPERRIPRTEAQFKDSAF